MKFKNTTLLITITAIITFQIALADQLTINFENFVPDVPTTCNETWSENGIEMEFIKIDNSLNYCGWFSFNNSNVYFGNSNMALKTDLSSMDFISQIIFLIADDPGCAGDGLTTIEFYLEGNLVNTFISNNQSFNPEFVIFNNDDGLIFNEMQISTNACEGVKIDAISFTYTNEPPCEAEPIVNARSGDVYVDNDCHGVILTSPDGNCFRTKVINNGTLFAEPVACP